MLYIKHDQAACAMWCPITASKQHHASASHMQNMYARALLSPSDLHVSKCTIPIMSIRTSTR